MKAQIIELNPEKAKELLKMNLKNRKVKSYLRWLTNQMKNGEWKENGEAIIIDKNGMVKDGQHRLLAVVASGNTYKVPLITDVEPEVMDTIDTGFNRSLGDILQLEGFQHAAVMQGIVRTIMKYDKEKYGLTGGSDKHGDYLSNTRCLHYATAYKSALERLCKTSVSIYSKQVVKVLSYSHIGLFLYIIGGYDYKIDHIQFVNRICGNSIIDGTAATWVFRKLATFKKDHTSVNLKWKVYAVVKAWNYFVNGDIPINRMSINVNSPMDRPLKYSE